MENMLQHANLSGTAHDFVIRVLHECPQIFRPRELFWQFKILSRYSADHIFFQSALEKKQSELELFVPQIRIRASPPARSVPMAQWSMLGRETPDPVVLLTQIFLQQILTSTELFLDLGSRAETFFLSESKESVSWVPEPSGSRWHEAFRIELARLYLGWAFDQELLMEKALRHLHLDLLSREIYSVLGHWREPRRMSSDAAQALLLDVFRRAEVAGIHVHPNLLVWALYELEVMEVLAKLDATPSLENSADELCRRQSRISA